MSFLCQTNSYLKTLETSVVSCEPHTLNTVVEGKKVNLCGYNIILEDTVLFPEGGGQPDDHGLMNDEEVLRVTRRGNQAVHFVRHPFEPGSKVNLVVDWKRRWDHMQQHSGQHLITAVINELYQYETTSWNLGERVSFIELDTNALSVEQCAHIEKISNDKILECLPMYPEIFDNTLADELSKKLRCRGLPKDHVGPIRVVTIETIESNLCCGTHVSNLSHLQMVKLLKVEKGKKNKVNLSFLVGQRVLDYLTACYNRETELTTILKGGPEQHVHLAEKLSKSLRIANKSTQTLLRELALKEVEHFKENPQPFISFHRKEGDLEYMNVFYNELPKQETLMFITTGDDRGSGMFLLAGKDEAVQNLGPKVAELINGKGAGKNGRFQGKAANLNHRKNAEQLIQTYLKEIH